MAELLAKKINRKLGSIRSLPPRSFWQTSLSDYQEIFPESCRSIAVLPIKKLPSESIVIGCEVKVVEYSMGR
jgi:hypothetical protein